MESTMAKELDIVAVATEIKGQLDHLLDVHIGDIWKAYKNGGNELAVSLKVKLEGESTLCMVKSSISYTIEKVTDEMEAAVSLKQLALYSV